MGNVLERLVGFFFPPMETPVGEITRRMKGIRIRRGSIRTAERRSRAPIVLSRYEGDAVASGGGHAES
jgi:hypothetical protein